MIIRKPKQISLQSHQSGFTIIECLIAIVVVTILMTAVAPVIAISVGTRVQSRRVELGTQAARSYIDGLRSGAIIPPNQTAATPFSSVVVPTNSGSLNCSTTTTTYPYCQNTTTSSLYCIDRDGNGCTSNSVTDMVIQAFRTNNSNQNYLLGVRVYRADAFSDSGSLTLEKQLTYSGGLGNRKAPLLQVVTEITTNKPTYRDYCDRLGGCN